MQQTLIDMSDSVNETSVPTSILDPVICNNENDSPAIINTMEYITPRNIS